jgi:hypothetical protein
VNLSLFDLVQCGIVAIEQEVNAAKEDGECEVEHDCPHDPRAESPNRVYQHGNGYKWQGPSEESLHWHSFTYRARDLPGSPQQGRVKYPTNPNL